MMTLSSTPSESSTHDDDDDDEQLMMVAPTLHRLLRVLLEETDNQHDRTTTTTTTAVVVDWTTPLVLSLLAGLSTCLGAATVFCCATNKAQAKGNKQISSRHRHLSFSLSMAASVMVTVSVTSILPEAFQATTNNNSDEAGLYYYASPASFEFWQRCIAFGIGCGLYMLLSKCAFPEPDAILGLAADEEAARAAAGGVAVDSFDDDNDINDEEDGVLVLKSTKVRPKQNATFQRKTSSLVAAQQRASPDRKSDDDDEDEGVVDTSPLLIQPSPSFSSREEGTADCQTTKRRSSFLSCCCCGAARYSASTSKLKGTDLTTAEARRAWRVAMLLFVSLAVHNFPEGLAVAASALHSPHLGFTTTIAIALHNIPEGIAIAVPCLEARPDSPWLAFWLASLSGLAEPLGAAVALVVLDQSGTNANDDSGGAGWISMKNVLAFVAGIMISVALIELFPEARRHMKEERLPGVAGTLLGAVIMIASDAYLDA